MMSGRLDQALDQWQVLVDREETDAYQVRPPSSSISLEADGCPAAWREKICEWSFQVVDHCEIDRDVVSTAMSYFDRYLSRHPPVSEATFQLVAMASLYLAIKLNSSKKISAQSMSSLSKGRFRAEQILEMEVRLISALRWRLTPPTPAIYLDIANPLIETSAKDAHASYSIAELSRYILELCVCDRFFVDKKPSSIAYASILVAMEQLNASAKVRNRFASHSIDKSPEATELCARRIRHVYSLVVPEDEENMEPSPCASPTTVFQAYAL